MSDFKLGGWIRYVARALGGGTLTSIVDVTAPEGASVEVEQQIMDEDNRRRLSSFRTPTVVQILTRTYIGDFPRHWMYAMIRLLMSKGLILHSQA